MPRRVNKANPKRSWAEPGHAKRQLSSGRAEERRRTRCPRGRKVREMWMLTVSIGEDGGMLWRKKRDSEWMRGSLMEGMGRGRRQGERMECERFQRVWWDHRTISLKEGRVSKG